MLCKGKKCKFSIWDTWVKGDIISSNDNISLWLFVGDLYENSKSKKGSF